MESRQLLLLLTASLAYLQAVRTAGAAASIVIFRLTPAAIGCSANTSNVAAASVIECAAQNALTDTWLSFSFINGVCVKSASAECAEPGVNYVYQKVGIASPTTASNTGYEVTIGSRRFWVFQHRRTGLVNFARNWTDYERGFGDVATDFWAGLIAIHSSTGPVGRTLRIEMTTVDGVFFRAEWSNFTVAGANTNYTMSYGSYISASSNTSGNSLSFHANMKFSTIDRDNDLAGLSCSQVWGGAGFWFNNCQYMNANGLYSSTDKAGDQEYMSNMNVQSYKTLREMRMMLQV